MEEPSWKKLKLSLEHPYKDDNGEPLQDLLDITPDGQHIYRPREDPTSAVGTKLRRIFLERGIDFFENATRSLSSRESLDPPEPTGTPLEDEQPTEWSHHMTPEELFKMRMSLFQQLHVALGEMCQARDLLTLLLSSTPPAQPQPSSLPPAPLAAMAVTKPPPIVSVQAFNTQLTIGGKDKALRVAADLFKTAAGKMEDGRVSGEKYWVDALKIRRGNWGLIPAPLPLGSATGKGADKTSKDFLISYGLEESPAAFRRRAIGRISTLDGGSSLEFPTRQRTRLRVSINRTNPDGVRHTTHNLLSDPDDGSLDGALRAAQAEVVEQEVFAALIREASSLPTASAEVSERLIVIDAAQNTELRFELIDGENVHNEVTQVEPYCNLVYSLLHVLLFRAHRVSKSSRLSRASIAPVPALQPPPILQPIIDILQYREFWERVRDEIDRVVAALRFAGVVTKVHHDPIADGGEALVVSLLNDNKTSTVGGGALLRIDDRHTLRFTTASPSTLIVHLPQATLPIASISQLTQLLVDEISGRLLSRICEFGTELCERVNGSWFVDLLSGRSVGRWQGCILNFQINYIGDAISCSASRSGRDNRPSHVETYRPGGQLCLFEWVRHTIESSLGR